MIKVTLLVLFFFSGCGYSTRGYRYKESSIRIVPAVNKITVASEARRYTGYTSYPALIEEALTNRLVSEFNIRSNLAVVSEAENSLVLECEITNYRQTTLQYTSSDDPDEQRLRLYVKIKLTDSTGQVLRQRTVVGQTTYYLFESESAAQGDLVADTARRITEAVIDVW